MDKEAQTLTTQSSGSPGRSLAAFGFLVLPNYPLRWASSRRAFSFASTVMNGMFRVWDGEMHLPPHNFVRDGEGNLYQWEQISGAYYEVVPVKGEVMQSTGLTDAEGTEIYEGDIVKNTHSRFEWSPEPQSGIVVYVDGKWMVDGPNMGRHRHLSAWVEEGGMTENNAYVIGNRYENPELLEQNTTPA